MNKPWYTQIMEYYSVLRNELSSHKQLYKAELQMHMLSEISQSKKATYSMIPTMWLSGDGESMEYDEKVWRWWKDQWLPGIKCMCGEGMKDGEGT